MIRKALYYLFAPVALTLFALGICALILWDKLCPRCTRLG